MYALFIKRIMDFSLSLIIILILSPFLIFCSILLFIDNNGSLFFIQKRPGLNGKIFNVIKLKTMNDKKGQTGNLLPDIDRITWMGKIIRKFSIDELPQLINVLKGDMSLIGPRPLLVQYLPLYNEFQNQRHLVRPGITGWAQVNGRNAISWERKFELDVWYIENLSILLDLKIILLTIRKVLMSKDINNNLTETMKPFTGTIH